MLCFALLEAVQVSCSCRARTSITAVKKQLRKTDTGSAASACFMTSQIHTSIYLHVITFPASTGCVEGKYLKFLAGRST